MTILELKDYIFKNNKIEFILSMLGCNNIKYNSNKEYYSASQPDGDNPHGVVIDNNKTLRYISYSRNISYDDCKDIINLIEDVKKLSFVDAIKFTHKLLGIEYRYKTIIQKKQQEIVSPLAIFEKYRYNRINVADIHTLDEELLNDYVPLLYIGWFKEGIMPWTAKKFKLAYSYKKKRVIIPCRYWITGELLGFNMRTTVENWKELGIPKYWITPTYQKSLNLYGLYENYKQIKESRYAVVVESEKSVLKRDSLCDNTLVAISGKIISDEQIRILIGLNVEVVIALDKDVSINEVRHMCEKFYRIRLVSYIYDKWGLIGDKDSPVDASNKVYNFMFKYRIKYTENEHKEYLKSLNNKN